MIMTKLNIAILTLAVSLLLPGLAFSGIPLEERKGNITNEKLLRERNARRAKVDQKHSKAYEDKTKKKSKRPMDKIVIHPE